MKAHQAIVEFARGYQAWRMRRRFIVLEALRKAIAIQLMLFGLTVVFCGCLFAVYFVTIPYWVSP
jgi:hypothetical protein